VTLEREEDVSISAENAKTTPLCANVRTDTGRWAKDFAEKFILAIPKAKEAAPIFAGNVKNQGETGKAITVHARKDTNLLTESLANKYIHVTQVAEEDANITAENEEDHINVHVGEVTNCLRTIRPAKR